MAVPPAGFEWDENKRQENMRLRHVDFAVAAQIFDGNVLEIADDRQDYGEDRILAFGEFEELSYLVVYT